MKVRRVDFSPDEWLAGTVGLTLEEEGLYIRLCALIWSRGGRVAEDLLRASTKAHGNKVNAVLDRLEAKGKITRNGPEIGQKRAEKELENAEIRLRNASENGQLGNKIKKLKIATRNGVADANHQPSTITTIEEGSEATPLPPIDPTKEVFDRGIAMLGKDRRSLLGKFCKQHGEVAVLEALVATEAANPVNPASYFIACMSRAPPARNGHDKHPGTYRPGPAAALFEGGYNAAEAYIRKHGISEEGGELGDAPAQPLLDRQ